MNQQLQQFARQTLKENLEKLPVEWQQTFKLMYGRGGFTANTTTRTVTEAAALPIDQVVDDMPAEKLDWAMQQVNNSLQKLVEGE